MIDFKFLRRFAVLFSLLSLFQLVHPLVIKQLEKDAKIRQTENDLYNDAFKNLKNGNTKNVLQDGSKVDVLQQHDIFDDEWKNLEEEEEEDNKVTSTALQVQDEDNGQSEKRSALVLASRVLFGLTILSMSVSLTADIIFYIDKCCSNWDVCKNNIEFQDTFKEIQLKTDWVDNNFTIAENLMAEAEALNDLGSELWTRVLYFDEFSEKLFTSLDTNVVAAFNNASNDIEQELIATNLTLYSYQDVTFTFSSVFDTMEGTMFRLGAVGLYGIVLAVVLVRKIYVNNKVKTIYKPKVSRVYKAHSTTIWAKSIRFVFRNIARIAVAANGLLTAVLIAYDIWGIYQSFKQCDDLTKASQDALDLIRVERDTTNTLLANTTEILANATETYEEVKDQLTSDDLVEFAYEVKYLAGNATNQTDQIIQAQSDIEEYLDGYAAAALNSDHTVLYKLVQKLSDGFSNVTYKISCLTKKVNSLNYAVSECQIGADTLENLFIKVQLQQYEDLAECVDNGYISWESVEYYVQETMTATGYQTDCILNNDDKKALVCGKWYAESLPDSTEAASISLTDDQVDYFIRLCPPSDLSPTIESSICTYRYGGKTSDEMVTLYYRYNSTQITTEYAICPLQDVTDTIAGLICYDRFEADTRLSLDEVLLAYSTYDQTQVEDVYNGCTVSDFDKAQLCLFYGYGFTRETGAAFYATYDDKYGSDVVDAVLLTCDDTKRSVEDYIVHPEYRHLLTKDSIIKMIGKTYKRISEQETSWKARKVK